MLTHQIRGGLPHPLHIRHIGQHGNVFPVKYRLDLSHEHRIAVGLSQGVIAGVEPGRAGLYLPHGDGVRQIAVAVVPDLLRRFLHVQYSVGHHGPGVNARVGAPRADDLHRFSRQMAQHGFQLSLYGVPVGLTLPAEETGAVIGDGKFIVLHISSISSRSSGGACAARCQSLSTGPVPFRWSPAWGRFPPP